MVTVRLHVIMRTSGQPDYIAPPHDMQLPLIAFSVLIVAILAIWMYGMLVKRANVRSGPNVNNGEERAARAAA